MIESLLGLERIYRQFDAASNELSQQLGVPICKEGCGRCCEITTPIVWRLEAVYAISKALGSGIFERMVSDAEGWLLERHSCAPAYEGPYLGELTPRIKGEFIALGDTPCPFLDADKSCYIHPGRPMACRAYGVTHMPGPLPASCPRPLGRGESESYRAWVDIPNLMVQVLALMGSLDDKDLQVAGYLPTAIFKLGRPDKYRDYINDNKIATAKLIGVPDKYMGLITQEQMVREQAVGRRA